MNGGLATHPPALGGSSKEGERALLKRVFVLPLLAQKGSLFAIGGALLAMAAAQGLFLLMVKGFLEALFRPGEAPVPLTDLLPPAAFEISPKLASVAVERARLALWVPVTILVAGFANSFASYIYELHQQKVALVLAKSYRDRLFRALLQLPYLRIRSRSPGDWMSVIMNDVLFLQTRFSEVLTGLVKDVFLVASFFVIMSVIHWPTALILAALSPFVAFGMGRTGRRIARYAEAFQRELARLASAVLDVRTRFDFVRSQGGEARERERFEAMNLAYYRMIRRSIFVRSAFAPMMEFFGFAVFALLIALVVKGAWAEDMDPDVLIRFFFALGIMLRPLRNIGEQLARYQEAWGALDEGLSVLREADVLPEPARVQPRAIPEFSGLAIMKVVAGFGDREAIVAEDVGLAPGRAVAVIGPSGAGKSTLVKCMAGLLPPLEWSASVPHDEWCRLVTMVSQEPFLFDDTLNANLRYGNDVAALDETEIRATLQDVGILEEVEARGLDTRVRAIGANLSGGQIQRLVIARALLRQRPVLLLDEATSAVDAQAERDIVMRLLQHVRHKRGALLAVTHRLSLLEAFDEVWYVEDGQVRLKGPHAELLQDQRYRAFCQEAGEGGAR